MGAYLALDTIELQPVENLGIGDGAITRIPQWVSSSTQDALVTRIPNSDVWMGNATITVAQICLTGDTCETTWPAGGGGGATGTVTSVSATVPTGLTITGSPITSSGTLAFGLDTGYVIPTQASLDLKAPLASPTFTGTPVLPSTFTIGANSFIRSGAHSLTLTTTGNTNVTYPTSGTLAVLTSAMTGTFDGNNFAGGAVAQGDLLYGASAGSIAELAKDTNATRYLSNQGTSNNPSWNQVNLANGVTGNLAVANLNSGTGASSTSFWRGDGTWAVPAGGGGGSVTSVAQTVPTGFTVTGSPVTTTGTLAIAYDSGYGPILTASTTDWQTAYTNMHNAVTLAGEDYLSLATQQITANAIDPDNLSASDFGSFTCNGTTCTVDNSAISNAMLANSSVSYGGVSLSLGGTDATPAFNLSDATSLPIATGVSGLGTGVATFLGTPSSANLASAVTGETGSGALVFGTSPSITSPTLASFFGTPCTGNDFLQDISDTGSFTCVTASGSGGSATTTEWRSTLQGWTFPDALNVNTDIEANNFHTIKPIWYEVDATGGDIGTLDLRTVAGYGAFGYNATNTLIIKDNSTEQFVTVSGNDPEIHTLTGSSTLVTSMTAELIAFATSTGFTGIELDWEGFGSWTAGETTDYINYVRYLSNEAHKYGLKTMIYLPPIWNSCSNCESGSGDEWDSANSDGYYQLEYEDFEDVPVDYLLIAVYDYHFDYGAGRPNAPLKWQDEIINYAKSKISNHDRLIIGIPASGYGGATGGYSFTAYTYDAISSVPGFSGATRDAESGELTWTNGGNSYFVSDSEALNIKRERAERQGIKRVSLWHIGDNEYPDKYVEPTIQSAPSVFSDLNVHGISGASILTLFSNAGTKFMEMLNTGITTLLGEWDFGGATSLEIPNGTNPTVNSAGEIAYDTTDNQLIIGATPHVIPTKDIRIWGTTVASTSDAFISGGLLPTATYLDGYTISRIQCHVTGGTSKVIAIEDASGNSSEDITCGTTNTTDDGSITNATYIASELQYIDFGATTGAVNYVTISVFGNWTRE